MPTVQISRQIELNVDEILSSVAQLNVADLEQFVSQVSTILARRRAPSLSERETILLQKINNGTPGPVRQQYHLLDAKRRNETLTEAEHNQLLLLIEQIERSDAERLASLIELAQLRGITVDALMHQHGIRAPAYA